MTIGRNTKKKHFNSGRKRSQLRDRKMLYKQDGGYGFYYTDDKKEMKELIRYASDILSVNGKNTILEAYITECIEYFQQDEDDSNPRMKLKGIDGRAPIQKSKFPPKIELESISDQQIDNILSLQTKYSTFIQNNIDQDKYFRLINKYGLYKNIIELDKEDKDFFEDVLKKITLFIDSGNAAPIFTQTGLALNFQPPVKLKITKSYELETDYIYVKKR